MPKYTISKKGVNPDTPGSQMSLFGETRSAFTGESKPPVIGERFILTDAMGVVINTSPVLEITDTEIKTLYSIYSIREEK